MSCRPARRALAAVVLACAALLSACGGSVVTGHESSGSPSGAGGLSTATYAHGERVYYRYSPGRKDAPWVVFIHGGGWYTGSGDTVRVQRLARLEVAAGYQFFSVDYRLSEVARWPAQRTDVTAAIAWIRANATRFGIDPARGVAVGESAGGQLAAVVGGLTRLAGVVSLAGPMNPPTLLSAPAAVTRRAAVALLGCPLRSCPGAWHTASAESYIGASTPPTLILHSRNDPLVPVTQSIAYAAAMRAAGRAVTLDIVPGALHAVIDAPGSYATMQRFLASVTHA